MAKDHLSYGVLSAVLFYSFLTKICLIKEGDEKVGGGGGGILLFTMVLCGFHPEDGKCSTIKQQYKNYFSTFATSYINSFFFFN